MLFRSGTAEVIGGYPGAVGRNCALPPEKLVALVEPVQGVDGSVVGGELQLGEARRLLAGGATEYAPSCWNGAAAEVEYVGINGPRWNRLASP